MKTKSPFLLLTISSLFVTGCQSTAPKAIVDINEDANFSVISQCSVAHQPQTVPTYNTPQQALSKNQKEAKRYIEQLTNEMENPVLLQFVQQSIESQASEKGLKVVSDEANCQIKYQLAYEVKPQNSSMSFSVGTGRTSGNSSFGIGVGKTLDLPNSDTIITAIKITLYQAQTPAWYSQASFDNKLDMSSDKRKQRIEQTVQAIFNTYPTATQTTTVAN